MSIVFSILFLWTVNDVDAQHSVARRWSEVLLEGIRNDFARPTVHARNLWHASILMYDSWAVYEQDARTYFIGNEVAGFTCPEVDIVIPDEVSEKETAQETAMSYAMMTLMKHRFERSPGYFEIDQLVEELMVNLGYDPAYVNNDYALDSFPGALGIHMAECIIEFGLMDGSNEQGQYENLYYESVNPPLIVGFPGNPDIVDPNRWQRLTLDVFIDQGGNVIPFNTPDFLSPEWGNVVPFALSEDDLTTYQREGEYKVYHDPGSPPMLENGDEGYLPDEYRWSFAVVAVWSGHLDPADGVMWDISPNSIGNNPDLPVDFEDHRTFYNLIEGGDASQGWRVNPKTDEPYPVQMVPRADYARVLAEFWADGPDSETPPGHWYTILNKVMDHPDFERKYKGEGVELDELEYDVKAYFMLGAGMHDVAITAWGIKGWYDYLRPVSAIRHMADLGQSSDPDLPSFNPRGIPLVEGHIEVVMEGDSLAMVNPGNVGKIKLYAWRGPDFIENPDTDVAGVGWILAENWWPYQRPSFVSPPFAGYISGHSTYSRAAAEILTMLTGDPYFPGGVGEFEAKKNEFLVFEDGPSVDMTLQWATYRDASDQTSLSRIWGGIHPPADDIPGRLIGIEIGHDVFEKADDLFKSLSVATDELLDDLSLRVYPNPIGAGQKLVIETDGDIPDFGEVQLFDGRGQQIFQKPLKLSRSLPRSEMILPAIPAGLYHLRLTGPSGTVNRQLAILSN